MIWKECFDICDAYLDDMLKHKSVLDYVLEAFEKTKERAWKQGQ